MTTWQKIKLKCLEWFASFVPVTDYALAILNNYLTKEPIARNIAKALGVVDIVLDLLVAMQKRCPEKWAAEYAQLIDSIRYLRMTLDDGKVSSAELNAAIVGATSQIEKWQED